MSLEILDPSALGDLFDPDTMVWVLDEARLTNLYQSISTCSEVVIDLETTGLDEHATGENPKWPVSARVSLAALTLPQESNPYDPRPATFVVPLSHREGPWSGVWRKLLRKIAEKISESGKPITNQNLKFDLKWIEATTGVDLSKQFFWDTQIASHLLEETSSTSLKDRAPKLFDVERWDDHDLSTPAASEKVPLYELGEYGARDTYWTWRLAVLQRAIMGVTMGDEEVDPPVGPDEVQDFRLGDLARIVAMPTSQTLTQIEMRGLVLDQEWTLEHIAQEEKETEKHLGWLLNHYDLNDLDHECQESDYDSECPACRLCGDYSFAPTSLWFRAWTQLAVQRGDLRVAALTPGGQPQWSASVLTRQARTGSRVAEELLKYRKASKRLEFLRSWLTFVTPESTIHTTYNAGRVVTGRLSSSDPNVQQISHAIKPAYVPRKGYVIGEFDYSQIELRLAAYISRSEPMLQAYREGKDLHSLLAARVSGVSLEDVTKDQRQDAKAGNFGFLYGMSADGFQEYALTAYDAYFTDIESLEMRGMFFSMWDGIEDWHRRAVNTARQSGQIVSPIGRVRRVPNIWDRNQRLAAEAERQAINSPVQGFASDLMQLASASIMGNVTGFKKVEDVYLVGTVHDSILAELPEDNWQVAGARVMRRMLDLDPILKKLGCNLDVPLAVEATIGTRWGLADVGIIK